MEKLQPVLKQIFWIMFGLALLLTLWGWWSASSSLSASIAEQKQKVEESYKGAGQNVASVPNSRWTEGAEKENEQHKVAYDESARELWKQQLKARVFPQEISDELKRLQYGGAITKNSLRERFAQLYRRYFNEQLKKIKPFIGGEGLVDISMDQITQEDERRWATSLPTSEEIWNAQEDIWLLHDIYNAIADVNAGAERIDKATIRALLQLELRGGDPDATPGASAAGGGFGGMGGDMGGEMAGMMMGEGMGSMGGGGGGGGGKSQPWRAYEGNLSGDLLVEEFGASAASGAGGGMGGGGMGGGMGAMMEMDMGAGEGMGGFGGGGGAAAEKKRYVHEGEELPYKTRGFILQVKMLQQEIPALLAALTNGNFPVEIVRVDASFGVPLPSTGMGGGMGGMAGGGMEGMEGGYEGGGGGAFGGGSPGMGGGGFGGGGAFGGGGMGAPGMGGMGMGAGGMGRGLAGGGLGGDAMGIGGGRKGRGNRASARRSALGQRLLAAAFADPDLSTVRVAGLMTIYEPREEKEAKEESSQAAEQEAQDSGGAVIPDVPELGIEPGNEVPTDDSEMTPAPGTEPAADGVPVPSPNPGAATPAEGSVQPGAGQAVPAGAPNAPAVDPAPVPDTGAAPAGAAVRKRTKLRIASSACDQRTKGFHQVSVTA